jgi:mono/diheme cytochrome c family protein
MIRWTFPFVWVAGMVAFSACNDLKQDNFFHAADWQAIAKMSPLPAVPPNPTNAHADDPAAAELGHSFYFETDFQAAPLRLGKTTAAPGLTPNPNAHGELGDIGKVGCNGCHVARTWYNDPRANLSIGTSWSFRNDPSLVNVVFYEFFGWAGIGEWPWLHALQTAELAMGATRLGIAHVVYNQYKDRYEAIFGALPEGLSATSPDAARFPAQGRPGRVFGGNLGPVWNAAWASMRAEDQHQVNIVMANVFKSIEAYLRTLVSRNAPFDRYVAGEYGAISLPAKRGLQLFIGKAGCVTCHNGPFFTDDKYHAIGAPETGPNFNGGMGPKGHFQTITTLQALLPLIQNPDPAKTTPDGFSGAGAYSDDPQAGLQKLIDAGIFGPNLEVTPPARDRWSVAHEDPATRHTIFPVYAQWRFAGPRIRHPLLQRRGWRNALQRSGDHAAQSDERRASGPRRVLEDADRRAGPR